MYKMNHTDRFYTIATLAIVGIVISLIARANVKSRKGWKSTVSIIGTDYTFENYVTISAASFIYAILQGSLVGASVACAALVFIESDWLYALYSLGLLLLIFLARLAIEGYVALYKTSRDASMFFSLSSQKIISENKYIQEAYGDDFGPVKRHSEPKKSSPTPKKQIDEVISLLKSNNFDTTDFSYEQSYVSRTAAMIARDDGSLIAEVTFEPEVGTFVFLEDGSKVKLME
jgi:hypothetical protein